MHEMKADQLEADWLVVQDAKLVISVNAELKIIPSVDTNVSAPTPTKEAQFLRVTELLAVCDLHD